MRALTGTLFPFAQYALLQKWMLEFYRFLFSLVVHGVLYVESITISVIEKPLLFTDINILHAELLM